ncbi:uncharacterized protein FIESC28_03975 [Fusarium coffeatum]|uniref:C2H2-type domain-containing protein n=1 Tax=Fusarium coffeatum TaxID=231269 RepID=A0A366S1N7_9HYPO|nr:uncharacterized protein FIESC28_03975 [Fusarium coffeatum]RBR23233.1 hypothetical protein FIESC28_03975 [Fusarium coffeatum]
MSSFTPINRQAGTQAPSLTPAETGLLTPPPTPPPVNVGAALFHFGMLTPPPSPPAAMPPPPPPTPVTPARAPAQAPAPARPSAAPKPPRLRKCDDCGDTFSYKNIADHRKVHKMLGDEGGLARPCKQCKNHPERCYVAIHPEKLNTYACACCLGAHKACSFKSIKFERPNEWADRHPFLLEKENIPPEEEDSTSNSSASNSNSSMSTSVSSVEVNPHNRSWEL